MRYVVGFAVLFLLAVVAEGQTPETAEQGFAPTPVTVHLKEATPHQVFADLGKQTGLTFVEPANWGLGSQVLLNVDIDNQAFWSVTIQLAMRYGYTLDTNSYLPWDKRVRIQLGPPSGTRKINVCGPLTIVPEISKKQAKSLDLVVYADPKLKDWVFAGPPEINEALDESGESVLGTSQEKLPQPPGLITRHPVQLNKIHTKLSSLKGALVLIVAQAVEPWEIPLPVTAPLEKKIGNTTYTVESMVRSQNRYELRMHVKGPADGGFVAGAADLVVGLQTVTAEDRAGKAWHISETKGNYKSRQITGKGEYDYTLVLIPELKSGSTEVNRLTWRIPTQMSNIDVPFEFKDVPLK